MLLLFPFCRMLFQWMPFIQWKSKMDNGKWREWARSSKSQKRRETSSGAAINGNLLSGTRLEMGTLFIFYCILFHRHICDIVSKKLWIDSLLNYKAIIIVCKRFVRRNYKNKINVVLVGKRGNWNVNKRKNRSVNAAWNLIFFPHSIVVWS